MALYGYAGRLLEVDLSRGKHRVVELEEDVAFNFIGGRGLAAYLLWRELGDRWEEVDPLGPENMLLVLTGPLTGYYPGVKLCISGKSPQSNGVVGSVVSSEVAVELRAAGYDGIVVKGASKDPVYLYVEGENVEIRSAEHLWGLGGTETYRRLSRELWGDLKRRLLAREGLTKEPSFIYIGPAGENRVRTAAVMAKLSHAAGYGGYGAVMGSKMLKAIAVKGFGPMPRAKHPDWVKLLIREAWSALNRNVLWKHWGTSSGGYEVASLTSSEPVRNWQEEWHDSRSMGVQNYEAHWVKRYWGDYGCPQTCMKISRLRSGKFSGATTDGPDYELQAYLGPNLGVFEPRANVYLSSLADELGLCGIQTGNVLGFAAELYEKGVLTREDLGFELKWGDAEAFARLMSMIARREGIGDCLAEGTARAALKLGKLKGVDLSKYAVHVKGVGVGAHGARSGKDFPQAFTYAVGVQGGDHTSPPRLPVDRQWGEFTSAFEDSAVICSFNVHGDLPFQFLRAITGWDITRETWMRVHGRRIITLQRVLLLLGGPDLYWDPRRDDDNPPRFYEPLPSGPFKGRSVSREEVESQKREYFGYLGWDSLGIPTEETLRELGLDYLKPAVERIRKRLGAG
ncbi:aldehyde ferredoxin oxidoreductase family protein [Thermofilum pendens]|uniref:Aldehyde ferredoxin oxidoreductase n=1 Tax=Thermofilum pendens (strain DSM 2475 / Hrk 5) TaxID=368408 RepID=A1S030_THEPD|nr:aldehyde ferredoxin oxidoreductase C-terminal domain-containing protein [Thermofilum pendens]ABL78810.1 Aldehyde ferredoxin oxidoreductase [Thermofilum pendens Hrk 5]